MRTTHDGWPGVMYCGVCRGLLADNEDTTEHDRRCGAMRGKAPRFRMVRMEQWERDVHERHVDLMAACRYCRAEAAAQPDRLVRERIG